jgi:hypothetical protein
VLLGLEPGSEGVDVNPSLPAGITHLALYGARGPGTRIDAVAGDVPVPA